MRAQNILRRLRVVFLAGLAASLACSRTPSSDELPPVVYICPMPKDAAVIEDHAGKCPICGMPLKPVRIVRAWSCLNNTAFIQDEPGKCKTNGTELVPITASMFWICPASPDKHELEPGKCGDGSDRIRKFEPRLHGDHNPRHGGQLFMADDGWHHLEGAYLDAGLFRVFFYDDWTRPLEPKGFVARVIVKDSTGNEVASFPLQAGEAANALEGKMPSASLPLSASLRVRFKADESEKLFDFVFNDYSKDPGGIPVVPVQPAQPVQQVQAAQAVQPVQPPAQIENPAPSPSMNATIAAPFQAEPIPATARDVLAELNTRIQDLAGKVEQGAPLGEYWFPALRTKDLAMALVNDHLNEIPTRQRSVAENAAGRLLRAAYAIDNFGDLGDREKLISAYETFVIAVNDLKFAYASIR